MIKKTKEASDEYNCNRSNCYLCSNRDYHWKVSGRIDLGFMAETIKIRERAMKELKSDLSKVKESWNRLRD